MATGVHRRSLSVSSDVVSAYYTLFSHMPHLVWLDSGGDRGSGTSILASGLLLELTPGRALDELREHHQTQRGTATPVPGAPLGLVGWLAYDLAEEVLGVSGLSAHVTSRLLEVNRSLEFDHRTGEVVAWSLSSAAEFDLWSSEVESRLRAPSPVPAITPVPPASATWRDGPDEYRQMISAARESIRNGEVYQMCLTTEVSVETTLSDVELHRLLREQSPTHHQALLRLGDRSLVSASPETFLHLDADGKAVTRPIKGTRPRGLDPDDDARLARELVDSEKERAENLMIVDLMRNDLQQVCLPGTVRVTGLFEVETYATVHQLVSTVEGQLAPGRDGVDLLRACFPAGSMTGAPKHRAVSLLHAMESGTRGVYSGAWGWLYLDGSMEWAMTIRSALWQHGHVSIGVGGGITWSSDPEAEIAEVGHKARRLIEVLGATSIHYS